MSDRDEDARPTRAGHGADDTVIQDGGDQRETRPGVSHTEEVDDRRETTPLVPHTGAVVNRAMELGLTNLDIQGYLGMIGR